jgi:hypothetical protein
MKSQRYQTIPLTIPSATPVGNTVSNDETLDRGYSMITGIAIQIIDNGGAADTEFLFGARTQRQTWIDPIPAQLWNPDGAALDLKFLSTNIPYGAGDVFFVDGVPLAALGTDAVIYMTVRLEESYVELPRK